jgi:hypothetical protein
MCIPIIGASVSGVKSPLFKVYNGIPRQTGSAGISLGLLQVVLTLAYGQTRVPQERRQFPFLISLEVDCE